MWFATKGAKFDLDNIKIFKEVYTSIENSYIVLRNIDKLVQEQGIGKLLAGFQSLDLDYTKPVDKVTTKDQKKEPLVLPLIQAAATNLLTA